jgi:hypothetical protein
MTQTITMVKKRLASGDACNKCEQAEAMLKKRGLWERIDHVVWALEGDESSPGNQLARKHGVELAPFFLVDDGSQVTSYESALKLVKEVLSNACAAGHYAGVRLLGDQQQIPRRTRKLSSLAREKQEERKWFDNERWDEMMSRYMNGR